ncbi:uncharacterized protein PAN0_005c2526 [Moesziomyces antarcticus]|uniref:Uncharacterized protein n=1 Tax=Pseudozyma antarctica TaxID=84753 RepID=A0A081CCB8_PSEA2|nr:uncharacterized protein PAN0_005c2526 [Moesziomyces antarcticus]GAK64314.1 hypothetical protein PAN0_005c2526 [Moesziomyces antarcticus]
MNSPHPSFSGRTGRLPALILRPFVFFFSQSNIWFPHGTAPWQVEWIREDAVVRRADVEAEAEARQRWAVALQLVGGQQKMDFDGHACTRMQECFRDRARSWTESMPNGKGKRDRAHSPRVGGEEMRARPSETETGNVQFLEVECRAEPSAVVPSAVLPIQAMCMIDLDIFGVGIGPATFLPHAAPQPKEAKIPHFRLHSRRASRPRNLLAVTFQPPTRVRAPDEDEKERNWLGECPGKLASYGSDEIYLEIRIQSLVIRDLDVAGSLEHPFVSRTSDTGAGTGTDAVPTPTDSPVDNGKRGTQRGGSVRRGADWEGSVRESGFHEWLHAFGLQVTPPSQSSNSDVLWYTLHTIPPASAFDSPGVEASLFGQFIHRNRHRSLDLVRAPRPPSLMLHGMAWHGMAWHDTELHCTALTDDDTCHHGQEPSRASSPYATTHRTLSHVALAATRPDVTSRHNPDLDPADASPPSPRSDRPEWA